MTPELYALGLRARNAKGFRWVEGMAAGAPGWLDDARILEVDYTKPGRPPTVWWYRGRLNSVDKGDEWYDDAVPVLDDDATLGCLIALVRDLSGTDFAFRYGKMWHKVSTTWGTYVESTFVEALVVALEAAP
jgi:hypothetical protein